MTKKYHQMAKNASGKIQEIGLSNTVTVELPLPLAEIISSSAEEVERLVHETGLVIMYEMMRYEGERVAGKKGRHDKNREYNWWGYRDKEILHQPSFCSSDQSTENF